MRILGLKSPTRKKRYQSCTQREINEKARHVHYNVLARNFKAEYPPTGVNYVYHKQWRLFLSVIKDDYDHSIVVYTLSDFNDSWDSTQTYILHYDLDLQYTNQQVP